MPGEVAEAYLSACILERRASNENQGEAFDLQRKQRRWAFEPFQLVPKFF